jgi:hypothetical protein
MKTQIQTLAQSGHAGDIALAEKIHEHYCHVECEHKDDVSWKTIKAVFLAHVRKGQTHPVVADILEWTDYTATTILVILRTYARATPQLKTAWQSERIDRFRAEAISRLYKLKLKELQEPVINITIRNGLTIRNVTTLIRSLSRADSHEQARLLASYTPARPKRAPVATSADPHKTYRLLHEQIPAKPLDQCTDDELWQLRKTIKQIQPLHQQYLTAIKDELITRLNSTSAAPTEQRYYPGLPEAAAKFNEAAAHIPPPSKEEAS